jgi:hypothetical protein
MAHTQDVALSTVLCTAHARYVELRRDRKALTENVISQVLAGLYSVDFLRISADIMEDLDAQLAELTDIIQAMSFCNRYMSVNLRARVTMSGDAT